MKVEFMAHFQFKDLPERHFNFFSDNPKEFISRINSFCLMVLDYEEQVALETIIVVRHSDDMVVMYLNKELLFKENTNETLREDSPF